MSLATLMFVTLLLSFTMAGDPSTSSEPGMVLIPGGTFVMGKEGGGDDCPPHQVRIVGFYMDKHEVTNAEYLKFCETTKHRLPEFWGSKDFHSGPDFPNHPVVGVSWQDAQDYAQWAGKRLPTEAEWELAARGRLAGMDYPNGANLTDSIANFSGPVRKGTLPVASFPANGYGLSDMSGNVVEWVADWYSPDAYRTGQSENPTGPGKGRFKVIRGGGWHSGPTCNRVYYRNALPANWVDMAVGFRCAKDAKK